jgi:DNA-binding transcriptional LysR family regulator
LRQRLQSLAPSVHVNWTPLHREETIDALRNARSHFVIDIEGTPIQAPDVREAKLFDDTLTTVARPGHPFAARKPKAAAFAGADHVAVNTLPTLELMNRALFEQMLSCNVASHVSSALVGVLVVLNSDALLTLPASLAATLEKQFGLVRIAQPVSPIAFPLRLLWHSSYDRDECHQWVRGELARIAQEIAGAA